MLIKFPIRTRFYEMDFRFKFLFWARPFPLQFIPITRLDFYMFPSPI